MEKGRRQDMRLRKRFSFKRKPLAKETVFKNIMQTPQDPSSNLGGGTTKPFLLAQKALAEKGKIYI